MPPLDNPRHERFAQELAKGETATDAYIRAGYKPNDGNAATLKGNQRVIARLQELQQRGASRAEITIASLIEEAEAARELAMAIEAPSAAVAAIREKGILSGKRVERSELGEPGEFDRLEDAELIDGLREDARRLGIVLPEVGKTAH